LNTGRTFEFEKEAQSLQMVNTNPLQDEEKPYTEGCVARLSMHEDTVLNSLSVACKGYCTITHKGTTALKLSDSMSVSGEHLDINILDISVPVLEILVNIGEITVHKGDIQKAAKLETLMGNVVFQSEKNFKLEWEQDSSLICLSSPILKEGNKIENCDLGMEEGESEEMMEEKKLCTGSYSFCRKEEGRLERNENKRDSEAEREIEGDSGGNESESETGGGREEEEACKEEGLAVISVKAYEGNIYANLVQSDGNLGQQNQIVKGHVYDRGVLLDTFLSASLNKEKIKLNDTSKADSLIIFQFGNYKPRSSSSFKFLAATNPAYLDAKPWWISFFSIMLLIGDVYEMNGRLVINLNFNIN
jgi:hypothetical protein